MKRDENKENVRGSFFRFGKTRNIGELKKILGPFLVLWLLEKVDVEWGGYIIQKVGCLNHEPDTIVG